MALHFEPASGLLLASGLVLVAIALQGCGTKDPDGSYIIHEEENGEGNLCIGLFDCLRPIGGEMSIAFKVKWNSKAVPSAALINFGSSWPDDNIIIHDNATNNALTVKVYSPDSPNAAPGVAQCDDIVFADGKFHYYVWTVTEPTGKVGSTGVQTIWYDGQKKCEFTAWPPRYIARNRLLVGEALRGSGAGPFSTGTIASVSVYEKVVSFDDVFPDVCWGEDWSTNPMRCWSFWSWFWFIILSMVFCLAVSGGLLFFVVRQRNKAARKYERQEEQDETSDDGDY